MDDMSSFTMLYKNEAKIFQRWLLPSYTGDVIWSQKLHSGDLQRCLVPTQTSVQPTVSSVLDHKHSDWHTELSFMNSNPISIVSND